MKRKVCTKCKRTLDLGYFNWKIKGKRKSSHCKECTRKYIRDHYKNNREYYLQKASERNQNLVIESRRYIKKYLDKHPCVDCGESNMLVLEFDHKDRSSKSYEVSRIIRATGSLSKLKEEIQKCEVRCANCHRIKTAKENDSWKLNTRL